jgi:hypothetical protein
MSPRLQAAVILASAIILAAAILAHARMTRYQLVDKQGTPTLLRLDRLTGKVVACLPRSLDGPERLEYHCDGLTE